MLRKKPQRIWRFIHSLPPLLLIAVDYLIVAMDLPSVPVAELRGHNGPIHIVRFTGELLFCDGHNITQRYDM